jgi:hypothetical protein
MGNGMSEIRAARRKRIQRFAAAQGKCRGFVRLAELAEYRARKDDEVFGVDESRLHDAFADLGISILKGDFEPEGGRRSKILCLSEEMPAMRLRADFLVARRIALGDDRAWVSAYLAHCWAPREDMLRWCEDKRVEPPPAWLRPREKPTDDQANVAAEVTKYGYRVSNENPSPSPVDLADDYIDRAQRGLMKPSEIEAELKAKGLPPLATRPAPEKFDPMAEVWWTMGMTAAWIVWRSPGAVRQVWSNYRREITVWLGPRSLRVFPAPKPEQSWGYRGHLFRTEIVTGYSLERLSDLNLFQVFSRLTIVSPNTGVAVLAGDDARVSLWRKLEIGQLVAEGIRNSSGERTPIRDAEWIDLGDFYQKDWPADSIGSQYEKSPRFLAVRVRSARVIELWPPPGTVETIAKPARRSKPLGRRDAVRRALRELWPDGVTPGLMIQQRDAKIVEWFKDKELSPPSSRTIARALEGMSEERA